MLKERPALPRSRRDSRNLDGRTAATSGSTFGGPGVYPIRRGPLPKNWSTPHQNLPAVCKPSELIRGGRRPGAALPVAAMLPLARKARHARPGPHRIISRSGSRTETRNVPSTSAWFRDEACPRGSGTEVERPYDRRTEAWRRASGIAPCRQRRRRRTKGKTPGLVQTVPLTPDSIDIVADEYGLPGELRYAGHEFPTGALRSGRRSGDTLDDRRSVLICKWAVANRATFLGFRFALFAPARLLRRA